MPATIRDDRLLHTGNKKLLLNRRRHSQLTAGQHKRLQAAAPASTVQTVQLSPRSRAAGQRWVIGGGVEAKPAGKGEAKAGTGPVGNTRHRNTIRVRLVKKTDATSFIKFLNISLLLS